MEKNNFLKLKPMLLDEKFSAFNNKDYLFEIKYDGIRALIYIKNNKIVIKSRNNIILNDLFPELLNIKNISDDECIFDGEIVLMENGKPNFYKLQERNRLKNKNKINMMMKKTPVSFICFDILYKNKDLTHNTLIERKKILTKFKENDFFKKIKYLEEYGKDLFKLVKKEDLEGIIAKLKTSTYQYNIRTKNWIKIKNFKTESFYICGYINTKDKHIIILVLGELKNNKYYYVGKVILGKKYKLYDTIIKEHTISKNYLADYNKKEVNYITPKHQIDICYIERTKNNLLRQPFIKK